MAQLADSWHSMGRMCGALEEGLDSWSSPVGTLSTVSVQGLICVNTSLIFFLFFSYFSPTELFIKLFKKV